MPVAERVSVNTTETHDCEMSYRRDRGSKLKLLPIPADVAAGFGGYVPIPTPVHISTGKRVKFASKPVRCYPAHLRHVATLPWEIKNSNFQQMWKKTQTNCILIASSFVIHLQILIFSMLKIAILSQY